MGADTGSWEPLVFDRFPVSINDYSINDYDLVLFTDTSVTVIKYSLIVGILIFYSKASNEINNSFSLSGGRGFVGSNAKLYQNERELKAQIESALNGNVSVHPVLCPRTAKIVRVFISSALTGMK